MLAALEITSGVLQGYYSPLYTDIARHLDIKDADVNWFEAAQLVVSAIVVPGLARLADLVDAKRVLLVSTAVTACGAWGAALAPNFWTYLVAWSITGAYVVWLPLEIALVHRRTDGDAARTHSAAAVLVFALEIGVMACALCSGALAGVIGVQGLLCVPAAAVTLCFVVVLLGVPNEPGSGKGGFDVRGLGLFAVALGGILGGLLTLRVRGGLDVVP